MDNKQFVKAQRRKAAQVATYINDVAPLMVVRKTLRFIDGNFRAQGWQGTTFKPWAPIRRKGTILVKTGRLRRSTNYTTNGRGEIRFYNNVPYADVHNRGLAINATVHMRAHTRRRFETDEVSKPGARKARYERKQVGEHQVKAHTRIMKTQMPQRQFMPYDGSPAPVLEASIKRELERDFKSIITL